MSEFSVDPSILSWLGGMHGYVGDQDRLTYEERNEGWARADSIIEAWARNETERAFLLALASGNEIAEARRLSGLSRARTDALLRRMRGDRAKSHKQS